MKDESHGQTPHTQHRVQAPRRRGFTLLARGVSIQMVGKLLGHSKIQSTMRYAHLDDNSVRLAAKQVSDGLADALGPLPYRPIATADE